MNKIVIEHKKKRIKIERGMLVKRASDLYVVGAISDTKYKLIGIDDGRYWGTSGSLEEIEEIIDRDGFEVLGYKKITIGDDQDE